MGARTRASIKRALELPDDRLHDFHAREMFVLRFHQRPRCKFRRRAIYHVRDGLFIGRPLLSVAPVVLGDLESLERGLLAERETLQLLLLADLQPEFADDR